MKKGKVKIIQYKNAIGLKLKNKRLLVAKKEEDIIIQFSHLNDIENFCFVQSKSPRKGLHYNGMKLTLESAEMLLIAINKYFETTSPKP